MKALLLALLMIQAAPGPTGFATGIVRSASGSPASGVRVYAIPAGDPNTASTGATVFESLAQTDASGRFRLEIPVGRYYIAVGSVSAPTYYPDTSSVASAKAISIVVGSTVESVDFSRYTAVIPSPLGGIGTLATPPRPPGSTGVLSGVVRNFDGSVAAGVSVNAVPLFFLSSPAAGQTSVRITNTNGTYQVNTLQQIVRGGVVAVTDSQGRYRLDNISPDTYNLVAGFSDSPIFYPGTTDSQKATAITTTLATLLTTLDFTLPPPPKAFSIRGHISANSGRPLSGFALNLVKASSGAASRSSSFLPARRYRTITTAGDGTYEIPDVVPGQYALQVLVAGASPLTNSVDVVDAAVNIDFSFSINVLSGRIVWEDGSPFSDPAIGPVAVSTTSNPNFVSTTLMSVTNNGTFGSVIEPGEYRVYIRNLPSGYIVRSMTIGSGDLSKDTLHVSGDIPDAVQIRVAKGMYPGARVRGRVLDATTGSPPTADHVELCCFTTGPFERMSAAVLPEGIFDFPQVPSGHYTAELRRNSTQAAAGILNSAIDVGDQDKSGILLVSASQLTSLTAAVTFEDGSNLPSSIPVTLTLLVSPGKSRGTPAAETTSIEMSRLRDGTYWTPFPTSALYTLAVGNLPEGYRIKSISRSGGNTAGPTAAADGGTTYSGYAPGAISIVLQRIPTN